MPISSFPEPIRSDPIVLSITGPVPLYVIITRKNFHSGGGKGGGVGMEFGPICRPHQTFNLPKKMFQDGQGLVLKVHDGVS